MKMNEIMQSEQGEMGIGFFKKDLLEDRRLTQMNSPDFDSTQVSFNNTRLQWTRNLPAENSVSGRNTRGSQRR